jgi:hypothetical protein
MPTQKQLRKLEKKQAVKRCYLCDLFRPIKEMQDQTICKRCYKYLGKMFNRERWGNTNATNST